MKYMNYKNATVLVVLLCNSLFSSAFGQTTYTLEQCRSMALEQNVNIKKANNNISGAQQIKKDAFTNYFPSISATGAYFNANQNILNKNINTGDIIPVEMTGEAPVTIPFSQLKNGLLGGITATQPVFVGGQIVNGNKLAEIAVQVNELQKRQSENEVSLTTEIYYWQLVTLKEKLSTVITLENMLNKLCAEVQMYVDAGVTTRNDLLQVELKLNEIKSAKNRLENGLMLSKMVLTQYIGLDYSDSFDVDAGNIVDSVPASPIEFQREHQSVLSLTPEYQLLENNVAAKSLSKKMEIGKNLPSIAVGAGYMYNNISDTKRSFGVFFATVSIPISNWWGGSHSIKRQELELRNAQMDLENNSDLLIIKMQKIWNELDDAYKQTLLACKSIKQATENLRLNDDYYKAGTINMSELLTAQSLFQQSRDQYVEAYMQYQIKRIEYLQATGN